MLRTTTTTTCSQGMQPRASGCVPVCEHHMRCDGAPECAAGYDLEDCNTQKQGAIAVDACHPKCAAGFVGTPKASCFQAGGSFIFSGCARPRCNVATSGISAYNLRACNTTSGSLAEPECHLTC